MRAEALIREGGAVSVSRRRVIQVRGLVGFSSGGCD